jgi:hypothetical protein
MKGILVSWLLTTFISERGTVQYIDLKHKGGKPLGVISTFSLFPHHQNVVLDLVQDEVAGQGIGDLRLSRFNIGHLPDKIGNGGKRIGQDGVDCLMGCHGSYPG